MDMVTQAHLVRPDAGGEPLPIATNGANAGEIEVSCNTSSGKA
jgi:hypothetical protein